MYIKIRLIEPVFAEKNERGLIEFAQITKDLKLDIGHIRKYKMEEQSSHCQCCELTKWMCSMVCIVNSLIQHFAEGLDCVCLFLFCLSKAYGWGFIYEYVCGWLG